jgi:hypothetical protein
MAAPYSSPRSKLDRAIVAYLIAQGVGDNTNIFPANSSRDRSLPNLTIHASGGSHEFPLSGTYRFNVRVICKYPAAIQPDAADPTNSETNRLAADALFAAAVDALMQGESGTSTLAVTATAITTAGRDLATTDPDNHADMADFTCIQWLDTGFDGGVPEEESSAWAEIATFQAVVTSANTD